MRHIRDVQPYRLGVKVRYQRGPVRLLSGLMNEDLGVTADLAL